MSRATAHLLALQEESGGPLPFERFMREALYHPEFGYYTARIRDVGARGDFSTFATLGNYLAQFLARWIVENKARDVIEVGPGNGQLAAQILGAPISKARGFRGGAAASFSPRGSASPAGAKGVRGER